jgi:hypothetical protein
MLEMETGRDRLKRHARGFFLSQSNDWADLVVRFTTDGMKKYIYIAFVFFLGVLIGTPGCKKEHQSMNQGVIVGWNDGACVTCGGFYINTSNDTIRDSTSYYVLNWTDAVLSVINQYSAQYHRNHLPIYISFDSQPVSLNVPGAPANWIRVTAIQSR